MSYNLESNRALISNRPRTSCSSDFKITRAITPRNCTPLGPIAITYFTLFFSVCCRFFNQLAQLTTDNGQLS